MSMRDAILSFNQQFDYEPEIENSISLKPLTRYVVLGMGGSHLAASLMQTIDPNVDMKIHRSYGLPVLSAEEKAERLVVASSYSGNTEEVVDGLQQALNEGLPSVAIATGGNLIEAAKENNLPYIQLPATGIQPRSALGYSLRALLKIIGHKDFEKTKELAQALKPSDIEEAGKNLAIELKDKVPVIYSSAKNWPVAYNWKIKFNETGKVPAFCNVLPELNHNEMTGFDVQDSSKDLSERFRFIFLRDNDDHPRIQKRFEVIEDLYQQKGLPVSRLAMNGSNKLEVIFNSLLLADWTAVSLADMYGLESEQVPMVEEFKKLIV